MPLLKRRILWFIALFWTSLGIVNFVFELSQRTLTLDPVLIFGGVLLMRGSKAGWWILLSMLLFFLGLFTVDLVRPGSVYHYSFLAEHHRVLIESLIIASLSVSIAGLLFAGKPKSDQ